MGSREVVGAVYPPRGTAPLWRSAARNISLKAFAAPCDAAALLKYP